jgi:hypothetical protein
MGVVRRFAVSGLDEAARRSGRRRGLRIGALDESGQEKKGQATANAIFACGASPLYASLSSSCPA